MTNPISRSLPPVIASNSSNQQAPVVNGADVLAVTAFGLGLPTAMSGYNLKYNPTLRGQRQETFNRFMRSTPLPISEQNIRRAGKLLYSPALRNAAAVGLFGVPTTFFVHKYLGPSINQWWNNRFQNQQPSRGY